MEMESSNLDRGSIVCEKVFSNVVLQISDLLKLFLASEKSAEVFFACVQHNFDQFRIFCFKITGICSKIE